LSRDNRARTYFEKIKELILATRLEISVSKEKTLTFWASNAPFGGNVVGLDAASWRYFNRKASDLSWSESATLAVLPNAPNLMYPGKNQHKLLAKRNRLLKKLLIKKVIDSLTYELSVLEELPQKAYSIPQIAPHLLPGQTH
jgi:penicillin-binding protein 1C